MTRKILLEAFMLTLLILLSTGFQIISFAVANPYLYHQTGSPPPGTPPISLSLLAPVNNTLYISRSLNFSFNVSFPPGHFYGVTYETDWQPHVAYAYYQDFGSPEFPSAISYSKLLAGIPDGNHSIIIHADAGGGYAEGLTWYNYDLSGSWVINFSIGSNISIAPPDSISCLDASSGAALWTYSTEGVIKSSPIVVGNYIFAGSDGGNVYCLDASTGAEVWNYTCEGDEVYSAVYSGCLYVGSGNTVYCLNVSTGTKIWNFSASGDVGSPPVIAYGCVFFGTNRGYIYCLRASTGLLVWTYPGSSLMHLSQFTGAPLKSSPEVVEGAVYVGSVDKNVYAFNALSGALLWKYQTGDCVVSTPSAANGYVYVGSWDGNVYCLDASSGSKIWNYTIGVATDSSPAVVDGAVYLGFEDGNIYCFNASTGTKLWSYATGATVNSSPLVLDGYVYVGSNDGYIYCLDASSGVKIRSYSTGSYIWSSPVLINGYIYGAFCDTGVRASDVIPNTILFSIVLVSIAAPSVLVVFFIRKKQQRRKRLQRRPPITS